MKIAGLDIGTTGCKLTVFDENGNYLDKAYKEYPAIRKSEEHEIDADVIWQGVLSAMTESGSLVSASRNFARSILFNFM